MTQVDDSESGDSKQLAHTAGLVSARDAPAEPAWGLASLPEHGHQPRAPGARQGPKRARPRLTREVLPARAGSRPGELRAVGLVVVALLAFASNVVVDAANQRRDRSRQLQLRFEAIAAVIARLNEDIAAAEVEVERQRQTVRGSL